MIPSDIICACYIYVSVTISVKNHSLYLHQAAAVRC